MNCTKSYVYISYKIAFLKTKGYVRKEENCTVLPMHTFYVVVITINIEAQGKNPQGLMRNEKKREGKKRMEKRGKEPTRRVRPKKSKFKNTLESQR